MKGEFKMGQNACELEKESGFTINLHVLKSVIEDGIWFRPSTNNIGLTERWHMQGFGKSNVTCKREELGQESGSDGFSIDEGMAKSEAAHCRV